MPLATFIVPSSSRVSLLPSVLDRLERQRLPPGWEIEILVVGQPGDPAEDLASTFIGQSSPIVGVKINAALARARGELVMLADDDDLQDLERAEQAIKAHLRGFHWSSASSILFTELKTGRVAHWAGSPRLIGTTISVNTETARRVGGWTAHVKGKDAPFARKMARDLAGVPGRGFCPLKLTTCCLQHGGNIWSRRPFPKKGSTIEYGGYQVTGMGHYSLALEPELVAAITPLRPTD